MDRRDFLKRQAMVWTGLLWLPKAMAMPHRHAAAPMPAGVSTPCTTLKDSNTSAFDIGNFLGYSTSYVYNAGIFVAASTYTCCAISPSVKNVGSPTFSVAFSIWSNNAGVPNTMLGTESTPQSSSGFTTSYQYITFTGLSASIVSGTTYLIVGRAISSPNDATNYVYVECSYSASHNLVRGTSIPVWTITGAGDIPKFKTYSS